MRIDDCCASADERKSLSCNSLLTYGCLSVNLSFDFSGQIH